MEIDRKTLNNMQEIQDRVRQIVKAHQAQSELLANGVKNIQDALNRSPFFTHDISIFMHRKPTMQESFHLNSPSSIDDLKKEIPFWVLDIQDYLERQGDEATLGRLNSHGCTSDRFTFAWENYLTIDLVPTSGGTRMSIYVGSETALNYWQGVEKKLRVFDENSIVFDNFEKLIVRLYIACNEKVHLSRRSFLNFYTFNMAIGALPYGMKKIAEDKILAKFGGDVSALDFVIGDETTGVPLRTFSDWSAKYDWTRRQIV